MPLVYLYSLTYCLFFVIFYFSFFLLYYALIYLLLLFILLFLLLLLISRRDSCNIKDINDRICIKMTCIFFNLWRKYSLRFRTLKSSTLSLLYLIQILYFFLPCSFSSISISRFSISYHLISHFVSLTKAYTWFRDMRNHYFDFYGYILFQIKRSLIWLVKNVKSDVTLIKVLDQT